MLGSFSEELVNKTINWYLEEGIAYFRKSYVPMSICSKYGGGACEARINDYADLDYYGVYKGRYISFEVKETSKDYFLFSQIRPHQLQILFKLNELSATSFLLLNFASYDNSCFIVESGVLKELVSNNKKRLTLTEARAIGKRISVRCPGVWDFLPLLELDEK